MRRLLICLFVAAAVFPINAFGCQCGKIRTDAEAFSALPLVITGKVLAARPSAIARQRFRLKFDEPAPLIYPVTEIDIGVTRAFKGVTEPVLTLTHIGCCVCEQELDVGKEYLLYVLVRDDIADAYEVSFCYPNRTVAAADAALRTWPSPTTIYTASEWRAHRKPLVSRASGHIKSWVARAYVARTYPNPFVTDPIESIRESPFFNFVAVLSLATIIGLVVVGLRRRMRRHGNY